MISSSFVYIYAFPANQDVLTKNQVNIQKYYLFILPGKTKAIPFR